eukprot:353069-Chlamydomonas_euryale.AAC.23
MSEVAKVHFCPRGHRTQAAEGGRPKDSRVRAKILAWVPRPPPMLMLRQRSTRCRQLLCLPRSPSGNAPPLTGLMRSCRRPED